jgi:hypothetical protein
MHPSLRSKRVRGTKAIWESSVNMNIRFTWQRGSKKGQIVLRNIGSHDDALRNP